MPFQAAPVLDLVIRKMQSILYNDAFHMYLQKYHLQGIVLPNQNFYNKYRNIQPLLFINGIVSDPPFLKSVHN